MASARHRQRVGGIAVFDGLASYTFAGHLTLRASAEDVFNREPAATKPGGAWAIYSRNARHDTDGGQHYVRMGMKF